jgi:hypothetical protein
VCEKEENLLVNEREEGERKTKRGVAYIYRVDRERTDERERERQHTHAPTQ